MDKDVDTIMLDYPLRLCCGKREQECQCTTEVVETTVIQEGTDDGTDAGNE